MSDRQEHAEVNFAAADSAESIPQESSGAKYEEIFLQFQNALRDLHAKHCEYLEAVSRQSEEERASNPIPSVIFWPRRKVGERTGDKSSTPELPQSVTHLEILASADRPCPKVSHAKDEGGEQ